MDGAIFGGLLEKSVPHIAKHMVRIGNNLPSYEMKSKGTGP